jgi:hypothetical protein
MPMQGTGDRDNAIDPVWKQLANMTEQDQMDFLHLVNQ